MSAPYLYGSNLGHVFSIASALTLTTLALYPILHFVRRGWVIKRDDIFSSFSPRAKARYADKFLQLTGRPSLRAKQFDAIYDTRYGRRNFFWPTMLFLLVTLTATFLLCETGVTQLYLAWGATSKPLLHFQSARTPLVTIPGIPAAAIAGAYVWLVADLISKARRLTLAPSDVLNACLRLSMAAALGSAVTALVKPDIGMPIAFALGAFPLDAVRIMFRRFATKNLDFGTGVGADEDDQNNVQLLKIDSIDHSIADRLIDADIATITQLAYFDPVQLSMKTGLLFDFIIDIQSQALAWIYFKASLDDLKYLGLRGAMEFRDLLIDLRRQPGSDQMIRASMVMDEAANITKTSAAAFYNACEEIAEDPYTVFLVDIWHDEAGKSYPEGEGADGPQAAEAAD